MPKIRFKNIREIDGLGIFNACNSLTNFEYKTHAMPGNGIKCKSAEIWMQKIREITSRKLIFWWF